MADPRSALLRWFAEHPKSVGESYWQHQRSAFRFAATLLAAGGACLVHGIAPSLLQTVGSRAVRRLHLEMIENRTSRLPAENLARPSGTDD